MIFDLTLIDVFTIFRSFVIMEASVAFDFSLRSHGTQETLVTLAAIFNQRMKFLRIFLMTTEGAARVVTHECVKAIELVATMTLLAQATKLYRFSVIFCRWIVHVMIKCIVGTIVKLHSKITKLIQC